MDIATTLKEFRSEHGLEQEDVARMCETTQQTVSNWETGTVPRSAALRKINHMLVNYRPGKTLDPIAPKPTFDPRIVEVHEIEVRSEHETRHAMAKALVDLTAPPGARHSPTLEAHRETQLKFEDALARELGGKVEYRFGARIEHQAIRYSVDYLSDKICAELKIAFDPRNSWQRIENGILRLVVIREILKREGRGPEKFMLVLVEIGKSSTERTLAINRAYSLASLLGIELLISFSPEDAAEALADIELGRVLDDPPPDY